MSTHERTQAVLARLEGTRDALPDPGDVTTPNGRESVRQRTSALDRHRRSISGWARRAEAAAEERLKFRSILESWGDIRGALEEALAVAEAESGVHSRAVWRLQKDLAAVDGDGFGEIPNRECSPEFWQALQAHFGGLSPGLVSAELAAERVDEAEERRVEAERRLAEALAAAEDVMNEDFAVPVAAA